MDSEDNHGVFFVVGTISLSIVFQYFTELLVNGIYYYFWMAGNIAINI